jgi:uncharacterized protein
MSEYVKPLPQADGVTRPYWESLKAHQMNIQKCNDTGKFFFYPRGLSPFTLSDNISWEPVNGKGAIHAFTIVHQNRAPGFVDELPYVVAMVELDEGPRIMTNIIDVEPDPEHVKVGMQVEIVYEDINDEITLPKFRPAN